VKILLRTENKSIKTRFFSFEESGKCGKRWNYAMESGDNLTFKRRAKSSGKILEYVEFIFAGFRGEKSQVR